MTPFRSRAAVVLPIVVAAMLLPACQERAEIDLPLDRAHVRSSPHSTIEGALAALESEDYGQFPALVGLALTIRPHAARAAPADSPILEEADFERVREILRAAKLSSPRISANGKEAAYALTGHGLIRDELHLFRHRDEWFFIVD